MKIREMDIYFTVPVDGAHLQTCREQAGYQTARQFERELADRGFPFGYVRIERRPANLRGDTAELIAEVLGMKPDQVFPKYTVSKTAAERVAEEEYYKPFNTLEERNAAIVAAMEPVKYTALKYCHLLKDQNGVHFMEQEDIIATAYETLVHMADRAMKKGIHKGVCFDAAACVAVRQDFLRRGKEAGSVTRKADIVSYDTGDYYSDRLQGVYDFVDHLFLRDETRKAVAAMPEEKRRDKDIQNLIAVCFPREFIA